MQAFTPGGGDAVARVGPVGHDKVGGWRRGGMSIVTLVEDAVGFPDEAVGGIIAFSKSGEELISIACAGRLSSVAHIVGPGPCADKFNIQLVVVVEVGKQASDSVGVEFFEVASDFKPVFPVAERLFADDFCALPRIVDAHDLEVKIAACIHQTLLVLSDQSLGPGPRSVPFFTSQFFFRTTQESVRTSRVR